MNDDQLGHLLFAIWPILLSTLWYMTNGVIYSMVDENRIFYSKLDNKMGHLLYGK